MIQALSDRGWPRLLWLGLLGLLWLGLLAILAACNTGGNSAPY